MAGQGLEPGATLGPYRIIQELGRGGMGVVFRAEEERVGRTVALKVILGEREGESGARFLERFRREGRAAAAVVHENVVPLLLAGEDRGVAFLAFEFLPGGSLKGLLRKRGKLPWREAAALGAQVARGLAAIHAAGLVHRDVKPDNVLLDAQGRAKVSDLGLVRQSTGQLTRTSELLGTVLYMAPEQSGDAKAVDARADLYALGVMLHELVAGEPPFQGESVELIVKHLREAPPRLRASVPDAPPALEDLILRLLSKEPAARGTAAETAATLEALAREAPARSRRGGAVVAAVAVLAVGAAVAVGVARALEA